MSTGSVHAAGRGAGALAARQVTLLDLLDRLLEGGIVIQGDITLAAADIDLVNVALRLIVASTESANLDLTAGVQPGGAA